MESLKSILNTVKKESPILYWVALFQFVGALFCALGLAIDDRSLMGINVWVKPLKFYLSVGVYMLTVGYLITRYPFSNRLKHGIRNTVTITMIFEMAIITFQAARGVQSHYNTSSLFDIILFQSMGVFIGINVLLMVFFMIATLRVKMNTPKAVQYAIFLGWTIMLLGSWAGGQMISQMSHTVGLPDGGEGLPLLNWSTTAGDLRVAHFFGLHAIQIIPLFAVSLGKIKSVPFKWHATTAILFGLAYGGWIGYIFYQAKNAMPFLG